MRITHPFPASWLALGLTFLVLGLGLGLNLRLERGRVEAREQERLLGQARVVQLVLEGQLSALHRVLGDLAGDWPRRRSEADFSARLGILATGMPGVRTLLVLDGQGQARASNRPELLDKNFSHRDYFTRIRENPEADMFFVSAPYTTSLGVFSVNLCRMIPGRDNEFAGLILATLDPEFFTPLLDSILYAPDMRSNILHSGGVLVLMRPEHEGVAGKDLSRPGTFFSQHLQGGKEASVHSGLTHATGEDRMLALRSIRPRGFVQDQSLVVGVTRDSGAIFAEWRFDALRQAGLFAALALVSIAVLFAYERRKQAFERQERQAAQALEDNERFMRTITDNIPGMVGYWDTSLTCGFANRAYLEWFGRPPESLKGLGIRDLLGEEMFLRNEPLIRAALRGEPQRFGRDMVKADGTVGSTMVHYIPDWSQDRVVGFFVLATDVTELKNAQIFLEDRVRERTRELARTVQELKLAQDQAELANGLKNAFLARVSHELRTPLNPILGMLELALDSQLAPEQREELASALAAAQGLHQMINELIEFTILESRTPEFSPVGLKSVLNALEREIGPAAEAKGLFLRTDLGADPESIIFTDLDLLHLVLRKLAENAVKFTKTGGVSLVFGLNHQDEGQSVFCASVSDTGVGMDPATIPSILSGFTQADAPMTRRFGGLGLGLAVVRRALQLLGGTMEVQSEPRQGSTFRIFLPVRDCSGDRLAGCLLEVQAREAQAP